MSQIEPGTTVTFSISRVPSALGRRKTLLRLMRMQPSVKRTLTKLQTIRDRGNKRNRRGGRIWLSRMVASQVVRVEKGVEFTVKVTPQIMPELRALAPYLSAK